MKKSFLPFLFLLAVPVLGACSNASTSSLTPTSIVMAPNTDYSSFGRFSIQTENGSFTYNEKTNVYTLAVKAVKAEYVVSGYLNGSLIIRNTDGLTDYKGVKITLANAAIISSAATPAIDYEVEAKNVEIKCKKNSSNVLSSRGDSVTIYSKNNVEFSGSGTLELSSYGDNRHTVKADGNMRIYGSSIINVPYSAHDAFHGKNLYFISDANEPFSGKVNLTKAASQAFDFESNNADGVIYVYGGNFDISDCDSVFKTDSILEISKGVNVKASNIHESAIAQGDASSGLVVTNNGNFTVDGVPYTYQP